MAFAVPDTVMLHSDFFALIQAKKWL